MGFSDELAYAELLSRQRLQFSGGRVASARSWWAQAAELGHAAIGIADVNTVAGVVRAHVAAKEVGLRLLVGSRLALADAPDLVCYPENRAAWGRLCRLLTRGKMRAAKGECCFAFCRYSRTCGRAGFYRRAAGGSG